VSTVDVETSTLADGTAASPARKDGEADALTPVKKVEGEEEVSAADGTLDVKDGAGPTDPSKLPPPASGGSAAAAAASPPPATPERQSPRSRADDDADATTVRRFVTSSGGAEKALKRYIASFGDEGAAVSEMGAQPPCRSYRSLRLLSSLTTEISDKLNAVQYKDI
jgi:hypothetical protein